ncbi:MAG: hypothetical protein OXG82_08365 [Gammaproteobacteria bacterium]|nr:hypothetical protein [Gammaproteobacteria bacterium]
MSARKRGGRVWPPIVLLGSAAVALVLFLATGPASNPSTFDEDFCPVTGDTGERAAFLVDVSKPLDADLAELPGLLLEHVTVGLAAHAELRVYTIEDDPAEPLWFVGRICKPYRNADLQVPTAKDQTARHRDCDDLPGQLPRATRDLAVRFCERRTALGERLNSIQTPDAGTPVSDAPLVDALEASLRGGPARPPPKALYVFSDMLHHSDWFSHLDAGPDGWGFDNYRKAAATRASSGLRSTGPPVTIFYLPRMGLTDEPGSELLHKRFWRAYFVGSAVSFRDQPPSLAYAVQPRYEPIREVPPEPVPAEPVQPAAQVEGDRLAQIAEREAALDAEARRLAEESEDRDRRYRERLAALEARELALDERAATERQAADGPVPEQVPEPASGSQALAASASSPSVVLSPGGPSEASAALGGDAELADPGIPTDVVAAALPEPPAGSGASPQSAASVTTPPAEGSPPVDSSLATGAGPDPVCRLAHASANAMPPYPYNVNRGEATVVLSFLVDSRGETLDESIAVVRSRSSAEVPRHFNRFLGAAIRAARSWQFISDTDTDCRLAQRVMQPIQFSYRP